jgi:hypothetical protein
MTKQELRDAELKTYANGLHDFLWFIDGIKNAIVDWLVRHPVLVETVALVAVAILICRYVISIVSANKDPLNKKVARERREAERKEKQ